MKNSTLFNRIIAIMIMVLCVMSTTTIYAAESTTTDNEIDYEQEYYKLLDQIFYQPDFKIDLTDYTLSASDPYTINFAGDCWEGVLNPNSKRYELNLYKLYTLSKGFDLLDQNETLQKFSCNGITYSFPINCIKTDWGYVDKSIYSNMPEEQIELFNEFDSKIVLGFFYESMGVDGSFCSGLTSPCTNLVTENGVLNHVIYIRINLMAIKSLNMNMYKTIIHETGHGIICDIVLMITGGNVSNTIYIWNNSLIEAELVNVTVNQDFGSDYSVVYNSISDYASTKTAEIASEAFCNVFQFPNEATAFNKAYVKHMLEKWETVKEAKAMAIANYEDAA